MHFYSSAPVSEQPGASRCPCCCRWFRSAGGRAVHRCRVPDADSVLVPTVSLFVSRLRYPLFVSRSRYPLFVNRLRYPLFVSRSRYPLFVSRSRYPLFVSRSRYPLFVSRSRYPLFVSRLRLHSAAHIIVRCVGVVFQGHPVSPDTTTDVVSSAMLIERTLNMPADVDAVSDGRKI